MRAITFLRKFCKISSDFYFFEFHNNNSFAGVTSSAGYEVLGVQFMKIFVFCAIKPSSLTKVNKHTGGTSSGSKGKSIEKNTRSRWKVLLKRQFNFAGIHGVTSQNRILPVFFVLLWHGLSTLFHSVS